MDSLSLVTTPYPSVPFVRLFYPSKVVLPIHISGLMFIALLNDLFVFWQIQDEPRILSCSSVNMCITKTVCQRVMW